MFPVDWHPISLYMKSYVNIHEVFNKISEVKAKAQKCSEQFHVYRGSNILYVLILIGAWVDAMSASQVAKDTSLLSTKDAFLLFNCRLTEQKP